MKASPDLAPAASRGLSASGRDPLRLLICGSDGAGKSTLVGRLPLGESRGRHDCYVGTPRRRLILAATPGDDTHDIVAGSSSSDLSVILVDAEKGLREWTLRQAYLCSLLGIRQLVLAVNKMDAVGFDKRRFAEIADAFARFGDRLPISRTIAIPISALQGDNVAGRSARMPWSAGPPLLDYLETVAVEERPGAAPQRGDALAAHLIWLSGTPLLPGRTYSLKLGAQTVGATVTELKYRVDIASVEHLAAKELHRDEIAFVNIATAASIDFAPYDENRENGRFLLIDRHSDATVGVGMIRFELRRSANTYFQAFEVTKTARAQLNAQKPALLWFTGLSGAGKSTIADQLERKLHALGKHTFVLDGDNVRHGLNRDLGFTEADRVENIRRVAEVAKLFVEAGLITLVSFISPFRAEREMARDLVAPGEFIEIFVNTPLETCEQRDPKGLYRKARRGELQNFTGLDSPYEAPENPELTLNARTESASDLADRIIDFMQQRGLLSLY
jgi:bifunctional enzyme CysN/CysC